MAEHIEKEPIIFWLESLQEKHPRKAGDFGAVKIHIKHLPPADVRPASEISEAVDEALRVLDSINTSGRLDYSDYCEMHDAICSISSDKGKD